VEADEIAPILFKDDAHRAAGALLRWEQRDLAEARKISLPSIMRFIALSRRRMVARPPHGGCAMIREEKRSPSRMPRER
jgi:hypothetical protein